MSYVRLLTVEDDRAVGPIAHALLRAELEKWVLFRRGILRFWKKPGSNQDSSSHAAPGADWVETRRCWEREVGSTPEDVLVLSTIDLAIPESEGQPPQRENGFSIIDQCVGDPRLPFCVVSVHGENRSDLPEVPFLPRPDFSPEGDLVWDDREVDVFMRQVRRMLIEYTDRIQLVVPAKPDSGRLVKRTILLAPDQTGALRDIYLHQIPDYVESADGAGILLLEGTPGSGRGLVVRFLANLMEAEVEFLDFKAADAERGLRLLERLKELSGRDGAGDDGEKVLAYVTLPADKDFKTNPFAAQFLAVFEELLRYRMAEADLGQGPHGGVVFYLPREDRGALTSQRRNDLGMLIRRRIESDVLPSAHIVLPGIQERGHAYVKALSELLLQEALEARFGPAEGTVALPVADYRLGKFLADSLAGSSKQFPVPPSVGQSKAELAVLASSIDPSQQAKELTCRDYFRCEDAQWKEQLREDLEDDCLVVRGVTLYYPQSGREPLWVIGRRDGARVRPVDLTVESGQCLSIVGPSGCGKSSLLRIIAGLVKPSGACEASVSVLKAGDIRSLEQDSAVDEDNLVGRPGRERGVVFQDYTCFPWLTAVDNVAHALRIHGVTRADAREQARTYLKAVRLGECADHYPAQLSGGQKQRVAIARSLAAGPEVLLMDEPFGALDAQTRAEMQNLLNRLRKQLRLTVVIVTHDVEEAIFVGDRVFVCSARPLICLEELPIGFRHRNATMKRSPAFRELESHIWDRMREPPRQDGP